MRSRLFFRVISDRAVEVRVEQVFPQHGGGCPQIVKKKYIHIYIYKRKVSKNCAKYRSFFFPFFDLRVSREEGRKGGREGGREGGEGGEGEIDPAREDGKERRWIYNTLRSARLK